MNGQLASIVIAACLAISGCKPVSSAFPLTIEELQRLTPENTSYVAFEERDGDIFVSIADKYGDGHVHRLVLGSASKEAAILLLQQKQAEIVGR